MEKINKKIVLFCMSLIVLILFINFISASYFPIYYKLSMYYNNGKLNIKDVRIEVSQQELFDNLGEDIFEIKDFNGNVIEKGNFIIPNKIAYDYADENGSIYGGKVIQLENVSFELYAPYYRNGKEIIFYNENNNEIGNADVGKYAKTSNLINSNSENNGKDNAQDNKDGERDIKNVQAAGIIEKIKENKLSLLLIFVIIVLVLIVIAVFFPSKKKYKRFLNEKFQDKSKDK